MKTIKFMGLFWAIAAMTSCQKESVEPSYTSDPAAVKLTAAVGSPFTRSNPIDDAASTAFKSGDVISVAADAQAAVLYTLSGAAWSPESGKYLKWETNAMTFKAYYPVGVNNASMLTFDVPADQKTLTNIEQADYMTYEGSQSKTESVSLTLKRQMARVVVDNITFNDQYATGYTVESITVHGNTSGYANGSTKSGNVDVQSCKQEGKFYALLSPTTVDATTTFLTVKVKKTADGSTETLTVKGIPVLEAGKSYTYNLKVGKDNVVITGITVNDWTTGEVIPDGEGEIPIFDVWDGSVASGFAGGHGTKESPYLIKTASQLAYLAQNTDNHGEAYYTLMSNIDLNGRDWTPIGTPNHFYGVFEGNGSVIKGLKVSGDIDFAGLFSQITNVLHNTTTTTYPSGVYNLSIVNADVSSNQASASCGILAGRVAQHQQGNAYIGEMVDIANVEVSGKISATGLKSICGGLAGVIAKVNLANCKSDIHISATGSHFGGLCGDLIGSSVSKCSASGEIDATTYEQLGGFAGQIITSKLQNCFTEDMIISVNNTSNAPIGGFVGYADSQVQITSCRVNNSQIECGAQGGAFAGFLGTPVTVKECTASGSIAGTWTLGGFVGNGFDSNTVISDCTTSVNITSNNWNVGGFAGMSKATINNCTASGNVTSTAQWGSHTYKTGGFAGTNAGIISHSIFSGVLTGADTADDAWKYYGGFIGNCNAGSAVGCRFDGTKNPTYDKSGLSWMNEGATTGNDISDSL